MNGANGKTILVADDDPDIRILVSYRMKRAGYEVLEAADGEEALKLASDHRPDLAILDVMMPRLDGFDVTRRLRDQEATAGIPVILLTARAGLGRRARLRRRRGRLPPQAVQPTGACDARAGRDVGSAAVRVLALDVGTSSVRAQAFGPAAAERKPARVDYAGETDPDRLVRATLKAIRDCDAGTVDARGASCFGHSLVAVGPHGEALTPVLGWRDTRSAAAAGWLARAVDAEAVHARTGCHIHTSYWPAKLVWLAQEHPRLFRRARFVSFADYLYEHLLKTAVPESVSLASGTGLLDLHTSTWDEELVAVLGIGADRLPEISDEPVHGWYPALIDGGCSNVGAGCVGHRRAALMVGTSGALRTVYETELPQPRRGLFLYRLDERRVVEGGALSDGGNLYHWLNQTLQDASGSLRGRDPDSHGLTFLTLLGGERSPGWHPDASGAVHGLTLDTTALDLRQAALEGVAFRFAEVLELMPEVEEVVATGGALLKDRDWAQIMADALARPVTLSRVKEASLRGAAVITLGRLGVKARDVAVGRVVEPRREHADAYRAAFERQRELYEAATSALTS